MISRFFIERPVLANVLALVFVLIGAVALFQLPVAQYPNVVPPTVQVTTRFPGASAKTLVDTVALPIELQVNGVQDMLYMQSTSASDGTYSLTVTFAIGTDPDQAQVLVQNRVAIAMSSLPEAVQVQGVTTQKKSTAILGFVTLTSPDARYDSLFLSNYAVINLQNELARLPGVGNVTVFGAGQYAMRIWMDPNLLQARGLTPQDIVNVVQQQSQEVTAGQIGIPPVPKGQIFQYTLNVNGRLNEAADYENIIVKVESGKAAASRASAISAASNSAPRLTASPSCRTAGRRPASAFFSCRRPTPLRWRRRWAQKCRSSRRASRRALNITYRLTRRNSSRHPSTKFMSL